MKAPAFQIFGSPSSKDYDVIFFVAELNNNIKYNHDLVKSNNEFFLEIVKFLNWPVKPVNSNLGKIVDGKLVNVFKGTYDEVNNSLYYTHQFHEQNSPVNYIRSTYNRLENFYKHLKLKRCFRFLLTFYSRTELRTEIKEALRGDFKKRLEVLSKIDFTVRTTFPEKKDAPVDIYKVIAFQLAQTISLFRGAEIYTKEHAALCFPELSVFLKREPHNSDDLRRLNYLLIELLDIGNREIYYMENLEEEIMGQ